MKVRTNCRGFTPVEIMITLGLIAIILSAAVPSLSNIVKDKRLTARLYTVMSDIHMARSEASKREVPVILCRSADPNLASPTCGGNANDWSTGYLVFTGEDGNNTYQAGTDTLLHRGQPAQQGVKMFTAATWNKHLEINPTGTLNEGSIAIMALCDGRGSKYGRQITIPLSGIASMQSNNIKDCTP